MSHLHWHGGLAAETTSIGETGAQLLRLRGIGPEFASVLSLEAFYRSFANRREVAAYSGLAPSPWKSGGIDVEQGISKAGNARLRKTMIQVAWLWLRHQPESDVSRWFHQRVGDRRVCGGDLRELSENDGAFRQCHSRSRTPISIALCEHT